MKEYEDRKKYIAQLTRDLQDKEGKLFTHQGKIEEVGLSMSYCFYPACRPVSDGGRMKTTSIQ